MGIEGVCSCTFFECLYFFHFLTTASLFLQVFEWFNITYVLNVTPTCPNNFEGAGVVYKRIPVSDTGTQKLSNKFTEAFEYIGKKNGGRKIRGGEGRRGEC